MFYLPLFYGGGHIVMVNIHLLLHCFPHWSCFMNSKGKWCACLYYIDINSHTPVEYTSWIQLWGSTYARTGKRHVVDDASVRAVVMTRHMRGFSPVRSGLQTAQMRLIESSHFGLWSSWPLNKFADWLPPSLIVSQESRLRILLRAWSTTSVNASWLDSFVCASRLGYLSSDGKPL